MVIASLMACGQDKANAPSAGAVGGPPKAMPVTVMAVEPENIPLTLDAAGRAEGSKQVEIRARVSGVIEKILFNEGERVALGTPMYQLERAPFEISLAQARSAADQARARVDQARRQRERLRQLNQQSLISKREYDDALVAERTAEAAFAVEQSRVAAAELNLSYTLIAAPIAGITGRSARSQGSLVNAGATEPLTTIVATDPIWVRFALDDEQMRSIGNADKARVRLLSRSGDSLIDGGQLNFTGSSVDAQLGTVAMRASFANPALTVLPGQFVQLRIEAGERQAYRLPKVAVSQTADGTVVWVVGEQDKAQPRPVGAAEWQGADWIIETGLKPGDRVIVDNLMKLRPGVGVAPKATSSKQTPAG